MRTLQNLGSLTLPPSQPYSSLGTVGAVGTVACAVGTVGTVGGSQVGVLTAAQVVSDLYFFQLVF